MTIEREMKLRGEFEDCRSEVGQCLFILLCCFGTFIFCAVKDFILGVIAVLAIQFYFMHRADKAQDRMKEIQWELDRG